MGALQPSLTVEDAAFDFEIQHGDTRETAIISSLDLECCLQVCSARRIAAHNQGEMMRDSAFRDCAANGLRPYARRTVPTPAAS
jgi:hypothetical protein